MRSAVRVAVRAITASRHLVEDPWSWRPTRPRPGVAIGHELRIARELDPRWPHHRSARQLIVEDRAKMGIAVAIWNEDPKPWVWHKTAEEILGPLARCGSGGIDNMSASS